MTLSWWEVPLSKVGTEMHRPILGKTPCSEVCCMKEGLAEQMNHMSKNLIGSINLFGNKWVANLDSLHWYKILTS